MLSPVRIAIQAGSSYRRTRRQGIVQSARPPSVPESEPEPQPDADKPVADADEPQPDTDRGAVLHRHGSEYELPGQW
jgi:hypothetical protein